MPQLSKLPIISPQLLHIMTTFTFSTKYTIAKFVEFFGFTPIGKFVIVSPCGSKYFATAGKAAVKITYIGILQMRTAAKLPHVNVTFSDAHTAHRSAEINAAAELVRQQIAFDQAKRQRAIDTLLQPLIQFAEQFLTAANIEYRTTLSVAAHGCSAYLFAGYVRPDGTFAEVAKVRNSDHACGDLRTLTEYHYNGHNAATIAADIISKF